MNLSDEELEKELSQLKPLAAESSLKTDIQKELEEQSFSGHNSLIRFWPVLALAAAACIALAVFLSQPDAAPLNAPIASQPENHQTVPSDFFADFEPFETQQRLVDAIDDGIVMVIDDEPVRRLRYQFIDSVTMIDQTDGSVFTLEVPREETLFVPVSLL